MIEGKIDILVVTEELDSTFPTNKFYINGFTKPYRHNRNRNGGGVLIYIREDVPSKELDNHLPNAIEGMFIEVNLKKSKRLLFRYYHSLSQSDNYFFFHVQNDLDKLNQKYNKYMLVGNFNAEDSETCLSNFFFFFFSKNIVSNYKCYKSVENSNCIILIITNSPLSFQNTVIITTGLSDFRIMVTAVLKTAFAKFILKKAIYRDYKNFNGDGFKRELEGKN